MSYRLTCPCGAIIAGTGERFLADVRAHLADAHPGRDYTDEEILFTAVEVPDPRPPAAS
jgi:hypothetical protein